MDFLQTLVKDAATIFLTTFAAAIAMRFANLPLKKKEKPPRAGQSKRVVLQLRDSLFAYHSQ